MPLVVAASFDFIVVLLALGDVVVFFVVFGLVAGLAAYTAAIEPGPGGEAVGEWSTVRSTVSNTAGDGPACEVDAETIGVLVPPILAWIVDAVGMVDGFVILMDIGVIRCY